MVVVIVNSLILLRESVSRRVNRRKELSFKWLLPISLLLFETMLWLSSSKIISCSKFYKIFFLKNILLEYVFANFPNFKDFIDFMNILGFLSQNQRSRFNWATYTLAVLFIYPSNRKSIFDKAKKHKSNANEHPYVDWDHIRGVYVWGNVKLKCD